MGRLSRQMFVLDQERKIAYGVFGIETESRGKCGELPCALRTASRPEPARRGDRSRNQKAVVGSDRAVRVQVPVAMLLELLGDR